MRTETAADAQRDSNGTVAARLFGRGRQVDMLPSPWLIIGAAAALALAVGALTVANHDTEQQAMRRILAEKGASLIRSFEAGARTGLRGRMGGEMRLQVLLEEMADQPDIHFIAVTDRRGIVLAHSDPEWVGRALASPETMQALDVPPPPPAEERRGSCDMRAGTLGPAGEGSGSGQDAPPPSASPSAPPAGPSLSGASPEAAPAEKLPANREGQTAPEDSLATARDEVRWRLMDAGGQRAFLVYRTFIPLRSWDRPQGGGHMMRHPSGHDGSMGGMGGMGGMPDWLRREMEADAQAGRGEPPVIIVALDTAPFDAARLVDHRHTVVMLFILGLLGAAGVVSLLWARHARASRRLLHQARDFALEVVTSLPDGLVVLDGAGRVATCNASARELLRLADVVPAGAAPGKVLPAPLAELAGRLTAADSSRSGPESATAVLRPDEEVTLDCPVAGGPPVPMSVRGVRIGSGAGDSHAAGAILILRDLREMRRLQDEVRRREKLAAIGSLAAGVAHELRNPLSSIKGYATYFGSRFAEGSEDRAAARVMVQEVERLNRVISDLIGLARPSDIAPRPVDAAFLVQHVLRLVRQDAAHRGVTVRVEPQDAASQAVAPSGHAGGVPHDAPGDAPGGGVPRALLDPDRFSQALLNVFLNALEAMPHGGELTVRLAAAPGDRIAVSVRDTGTGIAPEHLATIFDPYFTTKSQGTGLGLAIVHKIVEAHGGELSLRSAPGKGTEVTFLLPAEPVSVTDSGATATASATASPESPATAKDDIA